MELNRILVIVGPTAVGKTEYAIDLAKIFDGEIVSCDSMQLYKYMNIGSAKPTKEERERAVHHLVDFLDPRDDFSVAKYQKLARDTIDDILSRNKLPIISGGTGLYLNSILYNMDFANAPKNNFYRDELYRLADEQGVQVLHNMLREKDLEAADRIHPNNVKKIVRALERMEEGESNVRPFSDVSTENKAYNPLLICLTRNREELYDRINRRVDSLIDVGLIDEVKGLMESGLTSDDISMKGIGYKETIEYLNGDANQAELVEKIKINTRHYAKRQLTWFRRYDKMKWINLSEYLNDKDAIEDISKWLQEKL